MVSFEISYLICYPAISYDDFQHLVQGLLKNLEDYSIDQRGDVGSWIREESMKALSLVVPLVTRMDMEIPGDRNYLGLATQLNIIAKLLKQASERIDRTRACAGNALSVIVRSTTADGRPCLHIPGQEMLLNISSRFVLFAFLGNPLLVSTIFLALTC
jgi:Tubulin folding cofactor D C terminal